MDKNCYMAALAAALQNFDEELVQEIITDYEERFRIGAEQGKTEGEIIEELGNIEELVQELFDLQKESQGVIRKKKMKTVKKMEQKVASDMEEKALDDIEEKALDIEENVLDEEEWKVSGDVCSDTNEANETEEEQHQWRQTTWENSRAKEKNWKQAEEKFTASFNSMIKNLGKFADIAMEEAGKAIDLATEKLETYVGDLKDNIKNRTENNKTEFNEAKWSKKKATQEMDIEFSGAGDETCNKVFVDGSIASIRICSSKETKPMAFCYYDSHKASMLYPFYAYQEEDTFYVGLHHQSEKKSGYFQFYASPSIQIELFLPEGKQMQIVDVKNDTGDICVFDTEAEELNLNTNNGNVSILETAAEELHLNTNNGDIEAENLSGTDYRFLTLNGNIMVKQLSGTECHLQTMNGTVVLTDSQLTQAELNTKNGDCEVSQSSVETIVLDSTCGNLDVRESRMEHATLKALTGDILVETSCGTDLSASNITGNIKIRAEFEQYNCQSQSSGDVFLEIRKDAQISARSMTGDVKIELKGVQQQYQCSIGSVSGECNVIGLEKQKNKGTGSGENTPYTLSANSVSGDVMVKFL